MLTSQQQYLFGVLIALILAISLHHHLNKCGPLTVNRNVLYTRGPLYAGSRAQLFSTPDEITVREDRGKWECQSNGKTYYLNENPYTHIQTWQTQFSGSTYH